MDNNYRQCVRCVLDTTARYITFNSDGLCNSCMRYDDMAKRFINIPKAEKEKQLNFIINKIKRTGKGKPYDCILGLSGGTDSSYLAYLAHKNGLQPLVVHFDNGWNSELAVKNIENIVNKLGYDLHTHVINWEEFKDLQLAYMKASVVDVEVPTDYLIWAVLNNIATSKGIKYVLSGYNFATELGMPKGWNFDNKYDNTNLFSIHKKFGTVPLKDFPKFGIYQRYYYENIVGIETATLLNYVDYVKKDVKEFLKKEFDWKDYGGKHYESIFTRYYQGYILPKKFNIDKRKAHWSALICSGQATKQEALEDLKQPPYPEDLQKSDHIYVAKKFNISSEELDEILQRTPVEHEVYGLEDGNSWLFKLFTLLMYIPVRVLTKIRFIKATGKWSY